MSFKAEVNTAGDPVGVFNGNGMAFATHAEADSYALDLTMRWTAVRDFRVIDSQEPVNYKWVNGQAISIPKTKTEAVNAFVDELLEMGYFARAGMYDIKGTAPGDKDIGRLKDLDIRANGDEEKLIRLAVNMATAISPGSEKATRRAQAALLVYPGALGQRLFKIFMSGGSAGAEVRPATTKSAVRRSV